MTEIEARVGMLEVVVLSMATQLPDLARIIATIQQASDTAVAEAAREGSTIHPVFLEQRARWREMLQTLLASQPDFGK